MRHLNLGDRPVTVMGSPKGSLYKKNGRWHWWTLGRGTDSFSPSATMVDVRRFIERVCRVQPEDLKIGRPQR